VPRPVPVVAGTGTRTGVSGTGPPRCARG